MSRFDPARPDDLPGSPPGGRSGQVQGENRAPAGADGRLEVPIRGIHELPGGEVEKNETIESAVSREVKEETGMKVNEMMRYLGHFDYESKNGMKTRQFNFAVRVENTLNVILREHDAYAWTTRPEINSYDITESVKKILSNFWDKYSTKKVR